jgi:hypothetical protein
MSPSTDQRENREFASEIKFLVTPQIAAQIRDWARGRLVSDPNASDESGDGYQITSLYFDTEQFDVFHRKGSFGRSKYRIRRYGQTDMVFLERKLKTQGLLTKRRSIIKLDELERLAAESPERGWPGFWFHRRFLARRLEPVCKISYHRAARVAMTGHGPIRLTLDENLRALPVTGLGFGEDEGRLLGGSSHSGTEIPLCDACSVQVSGRGIRPESAAGFQVSPRGDGVGADANSSSQSSRSQSPTLIPMLDFLKAPFVDGPDIAPLDVLVRLGVALVLGGVVAWIYRRTRKSAEISSSFPITLVLLAILIAMVTQIIGDNVARAFSLVGALSIVRFRTVVRDTQDTAYVIFAVVVGMAAGANQLWVGLIGIGVVGLAAYLMMARAQVFSASQPAFLLSLRVGLGLDLNKLLGGTLDIHLQERELRSVATAKQGVSLDVTYETRFCPGGSADELVKALNRIEGVQSVELRRREFDRD